MIPIRAISVTPWRRWCWDAVQLTHATDVLQILRVLKAQEGWSPDEYDAEGQRLWEGA